MDPDGRITRGCSGDKGAIAFSVVAPFTWNSLPLQIRLLPKSYTPLLYKLLKTDLFHRGWTGSGSE